MSQSLNTPISSNAAIEKTIATDALVFRWFLYLISQKKAKNDLFEDSQETLYSRLKIAITFKNFCSVLLLAILLYVFLTKQFIALYAVAIIIFLYFKLLQTVRQYTASLSLRVIAKHFKSDEVGYHTLYQIGERLAKLYHIKSLVMSITSVDTVVRRSVLYALVFATCIFPLKFLQFWELVLAVYWATYVIINTSFVYKRLL